MSYSHDIVCSLVKADLLPGKHHAVWLAGVTTYQKSLFHPISEHYQVDKDALT